MASAASQMIEEVTAHVQSDSLEDAREIYADGTYFPNNLRSILILEEGSKRRRGPGSSVGIATELLAGRSEIESRWERDFSPVHTGPETHPASCTMRTRSFPGVEEAGTWG